jgi:hypothetical protein
MAPNVSTKHTKHFPLMAENFATKKKQNNTPDISVADPDDF